MKNKLVNEFLEQAVFRMDENTPRIQKCLDILSEEQIWYQPNDSSNSIGNLILHLCGNINQYAVSSLSYINDTRDRDLEFSIKEGFNKAKLMQKLILIIENAKTIIKSLDEKELLKMRSVQGFNFTGMGIIIHVAEHYSYHTGQIAYITKLLKNKDLGFYNGVNLNIKNKTT